MASHEQTYPQPPPSDIAQQAKDRGLALVQQGRLNDAKIEFQKAVQMDPGDPDARNNLGVLLLHLQRYGEAALHFQHVVRIRPDIVEAHIGLGVCLQRQLKLQDAIACYQQALRLKPGHVKALNNLGVALMETGRLAEAAAAYEQALQGQPDHIDSQNNLGIVCMKLGKLDQAAICFRRALEISPNLQDALGGLGAVLTLQGQLNEAMECFDRTLRLNPQHADSHLNRAVILLLRGQWAEGWKEYEWRWRTKAFAPHVLKQPRWDGSPLTGRTILLHAEQGLGDTLHFIRYAPLVKQRGGRVIFQCEAKLVPLLSGFPGVDEIIDRQATLPHFDVYSPLASLPGILGTTPETIPANIPYLHARPDLTAHWQEQLATLRGFKVGIAWSGSPSNAADRFRSIPLTAFAALAKVANVQLISLQKGPGAEQLAALAGSFPVYDLAGKMDETAGAFLDTAAVIKNLDLVLGCDTAIPHLAGALGAPVWVALSISPDWRWLLERQDTPWYPTMRLFRQKRLGDWDEVFQRIASELTTLSKEHAQ